MSEKTGIVWVDDFLTFHPKDSTARKRLLAAVAANAVPLAWNASWVGHHLGASYAADPYEAWNQSTVGRYFSVKYSKILSDFMADPNAPNAHQIEADAITAYSIELTRTVHPGLWDLGQRRITRAYLGSTGAPEVPSEAVPDGKARTDPTGDYRFAAEWLSIWPEVPVDETTHQALKPFTGFEGPSPIEEYNPDQIGVAAYYYLIFVEKAVRRLDGLTPQEAGQGRTDLEVWGNYKVNDPRDMLPWPTYPQEYHSLALARTWAQKITQEQQKNAAAWFTVTRAWPLLGKDSEPKPHEKGYSPLPPLNDPYWQALPTTPHGRNW